MTWIVMLVRMVNQWRIERKILRRYERAKKYHGVEAPSRKAGKK